MSRKRVRCADLDVTPQGPFLQGAANYGPRGLAEVFEDIRLMERRYGANPGAANRADCTDWQWAIVQLLRCEGPDAAEKAAALVGPRPLPVKSEVFRVLSGGRWTFDNITPSYRLILPFFKMIFCLFGS